MYHIKNRLGQTIPVLLITPNNVTVTLINDATSIQNWVYCVEASVQNLNPSTLTSFPCLITLIKNSKSKTK